MTVPVSAEWEQFVRDRVGAGRFPTAADVVEAGLRLLKAQEDLRAAVLAGVEQADRGQVALFRAADTLARVRARKAAGGPT